MTNIALAVIERKTGTEGTAIALENGKMQVSINGTPKEVAASTFKRWFKVTGEINLDEIEAVDSMDLANTLLADTGIELEEEVTPVAQPEPVVQPETENNQSNNLQEAMASVEAGFAPDVQQGAKELVKKPNTNSVENKPVESTSAEAPKRGRKPAATFAPLTDEQVAAIFNFEQKPAVEVTERICDITNGKEIENVNIDTINIFGVNFVIRYQDVWTTSVIVMKNGNVVYDSPKASLKDTFNYFGFSEDMQRELKSSIKKARKNAQQDSSVYWTKRAADYFRDMGYEDEFFGDNSLIITEYKNLNRGGHN